MADRIKPLKIETPEFGTQDDQGYATEANPAEDYVAVKGVALENLDTHLIDLADGEISFTDPSNGPRKLSRLVHPLVNNTASGNPTINDDSTQGYEIGSTWINTVTDAAFTCVSASPGAAVWKVTTSGGAAGTPGVNVEDNGTLITTTPASTLNFTGEGITVTETTPGEAAIEVSSFVSFISNILLNTIEIETLKQANVSEDFSYFTDTFENENDIDPDSANFAINTVEGYVSLTEGGQLEVVDTSFAQFNQGIFNFTEVILPQAENGSVRKLQLIAGGVTTLEDFEEISNVTSSGDGLTISQESNLANVWQDSNSLEAFLDFTAAQLDETGVIEIDLTSVDVSLDKIIRFYFLKREQGLVNAYLELEDTTGNVYTYPTRALDDALVYQPYEESLLTISGVPATPTTFEGAGGATGTTLSFDIGVAGNDRIVVIMVDDESSGTNLTGVTVDGKAATFIAIADNPVGIGNHSEMWYIDEATLGASAGTVTVALQGADGGWSVHAHLYYNAVQQAPSAFAINDEQVSSTVVTTETALTIAPGDLVVATAGQGASGSMAAPGSPLIRATDGPNPSSAVHGTSYVIETRTGSFTYTENFTTTSNRASMIAATWPAPTGQAGIDTTQLRYARIVLEENATDQVIIEVVASGTPLNDIEYLWQFDGNYDEEITGVTSTPTAGITFATGQFGQAIDIPSAGERVAVDSNIDVSVADSFTITAWVFPRTFNGSGARVIAKTTSTSVADHTWALVLFPGGGGGNISFRLTTTTGATELIGDAIAGAVIQNQWNFVMGWYDGTTGEMRVYVNDTFIEAVGKTGDVVQSPTTPVAIGNNPAGIADRFFDGLLDQVTLWNKALDASERTALFQEGLATNAEAENGKLIEQSFTEPTTVDCQRLELTVARNSTVPNDDLYVGIANIFGSTLGVARLDAATVTESAVPYILTFETPITLAAGNRYLIQIRSDSSNGGKYQIPLVAGDSYPDGVLRIDGTAFTAFDLAFKLLTPAVFEEIYIDQLETEAESTFTPNATPFFISRKVNTGVVPNTFDVARWGFSNFFDSLQFFIRTAATEVGLDSAGFQGPFTTASGSSLAAIAPFQWFQYGFLWVNSGISDSTKLDDVTVKYSVAPGVGTATIISNVESTTDVPEKFIFVWEDNKGTGTINYFISRDGKVTWQSVAEGQKGDVVDFITASGTDVHLRADITGDARLFAWGVACNEEFI